MFEKINILMVIGYKKGYQNNYKMYAILLEN